MPQIEDSMRSDGWDVALTVASLVTSTERWRQHAVDFFEDVDLKSVAPSTSHADPNEIVPDKIVSWLR